MANAEVVISNAMIDETVAPEVVVQASPSWFGQEDSRCFGWYHAPAGALRRSAVVLCPPFGFELLSTYRAYRHLAQRLAAAGFAVLRFDYPGTGDAPGSDSEPHRVAAWIKGVSNAVAEVRRRSGVEGVCLFGMRLGATIAAVAASGNEGGCGGIDSLVLVAPCVSGSAFVRELRAARALRSWGEVRPFPEQRPGDEEAFGFVFRADTLQALEKLDIRKLDVSPAPRALVIPRDDLPGQEARVTKRLTELGADVEVQSLPGYAAAVSDDPYFVEVPDRLWDGVVGWLSDGTPFTDASPKSTPLPCLSSVRIVDKGVALRESAAQFGGHLFGILSEPVGGVWSGAVVLANTGANHRIGANRFSVALARRLAASGIAALRMDLGGIGDSPPPAGVPENRLYAERSATEVGSAIDFLTSRGRCNVALIGLCSGGYVSFKAALADPRARALVMMNPLVFEWREGDKVDRYATRGFRSTSFYTRAARRPDTWKRVLRGDVNVAGVAHAMARRLAARSLLSLKYLAAQAGPARWVAPGLARSFDTLLRQGTKVLIVLNEDEPMVERIDRELGVLSRLLRSRGLRIETVQGADHVFAPVWSQHHVAQLICSFLERELIKEDAAPKSRRRPF